MRSHSFVITAYILESLTNSAYPLFFVVSIHFWLSLANMLFSFLYLDGQPFWSNWSLNWSLSGTPTSILSPRFPVPIDFASSTLVLYPVTSLLRTIAFFCNWYCLLKLGMIYLSWLLSFLIEFGAVLSTSLFYFQPVFTLLIIAGVMAESGRVQDKEQSSLAGHNELLTEDSLEAKSVAELELLIEEKNLKIRKLEKGRLSILMFSFFLSNFLYWSTCFSFLTRTACLGFPS